MLRLRLRAAVVPASPDSSHDLKVKGRDNIQADTVGTHTGITIADRDFSPEVPVEDPAVAAAVVAVVNARKADLRILPPPQRKFRSRQRQP